MCAQKITKRVWSVLSYIFNISTSQRDAEDVREKSSPVGPTFDLSYVSYTNKTLHIKTGLVFPFTVIERWCWSTELTERREGAGSEDAELAWGHLKTILWTRLQLKFIDQFYCSAAHWATISRTPVWGVDISVSARLQPMISLKIVAPLCRCFSYWRNPWEMW